MQVSNKKQFDCKFDSSGGLVPLDTQHGPPRLPEESNRDDDPEYVEEDKVKPKKNGVRCVKVWARR